MKIEQHIEVDDPDAKVVSILAAASGLSKQTLKQTMLKGAVWISRQQHTQRIRRADKALKTGDELHLYYDEEVLGQIPEPAQLIADEQAYSVWNKPSGMLSQGSRWGDHCTINRWVEKNLSPQRPAFIVHRLDRAATGLMIIAHQKKIAAAFAKLFQLREIEKKYRAIVHGHFEEAMTINAEIEQRSAVSHVLGLQFDSASSQSLVEVSIETGRKHQIRRHLAEAGFPIVGDRLYGHESDKNGRNLCLASCYLAFRSPLDGEAKSYRLAEPLLPAFESVIKDKSD